jgi:hypothetical protein
MAKSSIETEQSSIETEQHQMAHIQRKRIDVGQRGKTCRENGD